MYKMLKFNFSNIAVFEKALFIAYWHLLQPMSCAGLVPVLSEPLSWFPSPSTHQHLFIALLHCCGVNSPLSSHTEMCIGSDTLELSISLIRAFRFSWDLLSWHRGVTVWKKNHIYICNSYFKRIILRLR